MRSSTNYPSATHICDAHPPITSRYTLLPRYPKGAGGHPARRLKSASKNPFRQAYFGNETTAVCQWVSMIPCGKKALILCSQLECPPSSVLSGYVARPPTKVSAEGDPDPAGSGNRIRLALERPKPLQGYFRAKPWWMATSNSLPWTPADLESLWYETAPHATERNFRAGNRTSGPDSGRIRIGKASKSILRTTFGRPKGRF
jgi:hypothetical protein